LELCMGDMAFLSTSAGGRVVWKAKQLRPGTLSDVRPFLIRQPQILWTG
jgi:hypothetical protein